MVEGGHSLPGQLYPIKLTQPVNLELNFYKEEGGYFFSSLIVCVLRPQKLGIEEPIVERNLM